MLPYEISGDDSATTIGSGNKPRPDQMMTKSALPYDVTSHYQSNDEATRIYQYRIVITPYSYLSAFHLST